MEYGAGAPFNDAWVRQQGRLMKSVTALEVIKETEDRCILRPFPLVAANDELSDDQLERIAAGWPSHRASTVPGQDKCYPRGN